MDVKSNDTGDRQYAQETQAGAIVCRIQWCGMNSVGGGEKGRDYDKPKINPKRKENY